MHDDSDCAGGVWAAVADWRALAVRALRRMYRQDEGLFAFRLRPDQSVSKAGYRLEGISHRYTAIVLIALAGEDTDTVTAILGTTAPSEVCDRLIQAVDDTQDIGEVALTLWAARVLEHPRAARVLARLREMDPVTRTCPTVELAWVLTALAVEGSRTRDDALAEAVAWRLLASFRQESGLFPHWPAAASDGQQPAPHRTGRLRSHVTCFADLVYPVQALSHYYQVTGEQTVLRVAQACADRMGSLQGPQGQWWWHYDVRTGRVVERYPVYAVHQDAMGPMALTALRSAGGKPPEKAIERSVRWLMDPPEIEESLVDRQADVIWRKVARKEPNKLSRRLQAITSRIHPSLRMPGLDAILPPVLVDYESRPYHMGWLLYAFPAPDVASRSPVRGAATLSDGPAGQKQKIDRESQDLAPRDANDLKTESRVRAEG